MTGYAFTNLLLNVSADETLSQWVDVRGRTALTFYLTSVGTTSGGVVSLEEQMPVGTDTVPGQPYSGTNISITTVNASTFTGGAQVVSRATIGAYGFVRARISTAISGGGTVSVSLLAV
jgi:hypothetical protein